MGLLNLKKKVIAGVVTLSVVGGAGAAFADFDASTLLGQYYTGKNVANLMTTVERNVGTYAKNLIKNLNNDWFKWLKEDRIVNDITGAGKTGTFTATQKIKDTKDNYVKTVNDDKASILTKIEGDFAGLQTKLNGQVDKATPDAIKNAIGQVSKLITDTTNSRNTETEKTIVDASNAANKELKDTIDAAKIEIDNSLDSKYATTESNVTKYIDEKVEFGKPLVEKSAYEAQEVGKKSKVEDAKDNVTKFAKDLEDNAIRDLDALMGK